MPVTLFTEGARQTRAHFERDFVVGFRVGARIGGSPVGFGLVGLLVGLTDDSNTTAVLASASVAGLSSSLGGMSVRSASKRPIRWRW